MAGLDSFDFMRNASISFVEKTCISKIPETLKGHCRAEIMKFC